MRYFRILKAWWYDAPALIRHFWQPSYTTFNSEGKKYRDRYEVRSFKEPASVGDLAGLLKDGDRIHIYEITKRKRSKGSDHIASPYRYDFIYHSTMSVEEFESLDRKQTSQSSLLSIW